LVFPGHQEAKEHQEDSAEAAAADHGTWRRGAPRQKRLGKSWSAGFGNRGLGGWQTRQREVCTGEERREGGWVGSERC